MVPLVPVRTNKAIPKGLQFQCLQEIRKLRVKAPIKIL
ncbi:MAG: DUF1667 domain-containing protein [Firmicutes bacterium]|nr:DUF1667 domain-containing protein [Bacillota bacterium]